MLPVSPRPARPPSVSRARRWARPRPPRRAWPPREDRPRNQRSQTAVKGCRVSSCSSSIRGRRAAARAAPTVCAATAKPRPQDEQAAAAGHRTFRCSAFIFSFLSAGVSFFFFFFFGVGASSACACSCCTMGDMANISGSCEPSLRAEPPDERFTAGSTSGVYVRAQQQAAGGFLMYRDRCSLRNHPRRRRRRR